MPLRILRNSAEMLGLSHSLAEIHSCHDNQDSLNTPSKETSTISSDSIDIEQESDGINPVALKWKKRSGLKATDLQPLFCLGIVELVLVAMTIAGICISVRLRYVLLLKGIAAYLSSGVPR